MDFGLISGVPTPCGMRSIVRAQLFGQPHEALFGIGTDLEPHDDKALAVARGRVDVFHARDFPEQLFHRPGGALLDFLRGEAGHVHHHVDHRHLDLRLLLARQQNDCGDAEQNRRDDD